MDVTIKDIAKLAGCSHTLVSQVLRGSPNCRASRETRMKILRLSCELNYRPISRDTRCLFYRLPH